MEILCLMVVLLLIILLILIGSNVIYKDTIKYLAGQVSLINGGGSATVEYPEGFNKDNCIPISTGVGIISDSIFSYNSNQATHLYEIRLTDSNIQIHIKGIGGIGSNKTVKYKVALLKID